MSRKGRLKKQKHSRLHQLQLKGRIKMRNIFTTLAIAEILALTMLLVAACAPKTAEQPPAAPSAPEAAEQPSPPAAASEVPEIAQAEQAVQEIGASNLDEVESGLDELVLP